MATNETKVVPIRPGPPWEKHPAPWRYEDGDILDANGDSVEVSIGQLRHLIAAVNAHGPMREALEEAQVVFRLSDPKGDRLRIHAPEDEEIRALCERIGYGAVMDAACRLWREKDPLGAHTTGAAVATVRKTLKQVRAALALAQKVGTP